MADEQTNVEQTSTETETKVATAEPEIGEAGRKAIAVERQRAAEEEKARKAAERKAAQLEAEVVRFREAVPGPPSAPDADGAGAGARDSDVQPSRYAADEPASTPGKVPAIRSTCGFTGNTGPDLRKHRSTSVSV